MIVSLLQRQCAACEVGALIRNMKWTIMNIATLHLSFKGCEHAGSRDINIYATPLNLPVTVK